MGCGTCTTVCPSGALTYAYPGPADVGARLRTLLATLCEGGRTRRVPAVARPRTAARRSRSTRGTAAGLPARVIPVEVHSIDSIGLDLWLAALAWGATDIVVAGCRARTSSATAGLAGFQMRARRHDRPGARLPGPRTSRIVNGDDPPRSMLRCGTSIRRSACAMPATFAATNEKRTTLSLAIDHLALHAPVPQRRDRAAGGLAVRRDRRRPATRARCASPAWAAARKARSSTTPSGRSCASSRASACSAASARRPAPSPRSRSCPGWT